MVDDLELAQFIYLITTNEKIKNVIDTITSTAPIHEGRLRLAYLLKARRSAGRW